MPSRSRSAGPQQLIKQVDDNLIVFTRPDTGEDLTLFINDRFLLNWEGQHLSRVLGAAPAAEVMTLTDYFFKVADELKRRWPGQTSRLAQEGWLRQFAAGYRKDLADRQTAERQKQRELDAVFLAHPTPSI